MARIVRKISRRRWSQSACAGLGPGMPDKQFAAIKVNPHDSSGWTEAAVLLLAVFSGSWVGQKLKLEDVLSFQVRGFEE